MWGKRNDWVEQGGGGGGCSIQGRLRKDLLSKVRLPVHLRKVHS